MPLFTAALAGKDSAVKAIAIEGLARTRDAEPPRRDPCTAVAGERSDERAARGLVRGRRAERQRSARSARRRAAQPRARDQARGYLIEIAPGHAAAFSRQLQDPDARLRGEIVDILGLSGDRAALPLVEPMTKDPNPVVALAAQRAVARLR